jgi:hypothetical protein
LTIISAEKKYNKKIVNTKFHMQIDAGKGEGGGRQIDWENCAWDADKFNNLTQQWLARVLAADSRPGSKNIM